MPGLRSGPDMAKGTRRPPALRFDPPQRSSANTSVNDDAVPWASNSMRNTLW
jgi:hypothetical protein